MHLTTPPTRVRMGASPWSLVTAIRFVQRCVTTRSGLYGVLAVGLYIFLVGVLLLSSRFLPYVTDNNESFSMFIHARNMLKFGLGHAAGLSDESYAIDPAGHPYVYTHEGNFPRLPIYFLMLLGITKIEWQITLHAVILGAATIYLCFRFFSRIGGPLFALVVCTVFSTDYLLFMQWEVNTFRVWHGFLFFLSLVCVQSISDIGQLKAGPLLFLTFVALSYFEVVFAVFVLAMCIAYALITYRQRRLVLRAALIGVAGMTVALCGLLGQSIAHFGWAVAWRDIQFTLISRNFYAQTLGRLSGDALGFFLKHHIVYWLDNPDTRGYLSVAHFLYTVGGPILLVYTPYLMFVAWALTVPWAFGIALRLRAVAQRRGRPSSRDRVSGYVSLRATLFSVNSGLALLTIVYAAVSFVLGYLVFDLRGLLQPAHQDTDRILWGVLAIPAGARKVLPPLWGDAIQGYFGDRLLKAGLFGCILLVWIVVIVKGGGYLRAQNGRSFIGVLRYLMAGGAAVACVYILFPGYLWAGYLVRYAPLTVFVVDVWIALFFWMLVIVVGASGRAVIAELARSASKGGIGKVLSVSNSLFVCGLSLFVLVLGSMYWLRIQTVYANILAPTSFSVLRELGQGMYRGSTFISNVYAAPIAYYTGNWAYMDSVVSDNIGEYRLGKTTQLIGGEYLWEADRESNTDYLHPRYYLCITAPTLDMAARIIALRGRGRLSNCSSQPLVRDAQERIGPFANILVALDPSSRDMWAIVKLDPSIQFIREH